MLSTHQDKLYVIYLLNTFSLEWMIVLNKHTSSGVFTSSILLSSTQTNRQVKYLAGKL